MRMSTTILRLAQASTVRGAIHTVRPARLVAAAAAAVQSSAPTACTRRAFFTSSLFGGGRSGDAGEAAVRQQHESALRSANQSASLQSERLLDACMDLLELCGGTASGAAGPRPALDYASRETLWEVADVLLHHHRRPPWEQYDLVYLALCLPVARQERQVERSLMVILESILPLPLFRVFEAHNLFLTQDDEQSQEHRAVLRRFAHALLGDLRAPPGVEDAEVLLVYSDDLCRAFPSLVDAPAFVELQQDVEGIALRAKLFSLLGQLCAEFDREQTGKVLLSELKETAERVLGEDQARMLLAGAPVDSEGRIAYPQLASLLTRPPPRKPVAAE